MCVANMSQFTTLGANVERRRRVIRRPLCCRRPLHATAQCQRWLGIASEPDWFRWWTELSATRRSASSGLSKRAQRNSRAYGASRNGSLLSCGWGCRLKRLNDTVSRYRVDPSHGSGPVPLTRALGPLCPDQRISSACRGSRCVPIPTLQLKKCLVVTFLTDSSTPGHSDRLRLESVQRSDSIGR